MSGIETVAFLSVVGVLITGLVLCVCFTAVNAALHRLSDEKIGEINRTLADHGETTRQIVTSLENLVQHLDDVDSDMNVLRKDIAALHYRRLPEMETEAKNRRAVLHRQRSRFLH
ncbi:MAG: hypothetical protein WD270_06285 [Acetobacterales bacterium]